MSSALQPARSVRYKDVTEAKFDGATFTPRNLAGFVARQIAANVQASNPRSIRALDPAVGEGALLTSLLEELFAHGIRNVEVHGFDTNPSSLRVAEQAIHTRFPSVPTNFSAINFLEYAERFASADSLFSGEIDRGDIDENKFDIIIANPPYVRTQIMGAAAAQALATHFGLGGRIDLYHAFLLGMIEALGDNGVAGIIVSNRFMTTKSGSSVRRALRETASLKHIWDMGDTKLFGAAVLPAVILLAKGERQGKETPRFTSIYETDEPASRGAEDAIAALTESGTVSIADGRRFHVTHGTLDLSTALEGVWRVASEESDDWLKTVEKHTWRRFGDIGSIRVGIKTCADQVFIRTDWDSFEKHDLPELLRPLTTHHMGRRFKANQAKSGRQVLYPHLTKDGRREAADLASFPRSAAYLEKHRPALEGRAYVLEAGRKWYEIWVPQDPEAWELPKLVFRDICERPTFWIDLDGSIVNGDCYWLSPNRGTDSELLWLALAVANSTFIETFYDRRFNNKLYAGRRRFITQYVECFPLPDPSREEARTLAKLAREIYDKMPATETKELESRLDELVWQAFGVNRNLNLNRKSRGAM